MNDNDFLSSHRVAELLKASPSAVISWFDQGKLTGFRTPGGHRRVKVDELRRFLADHNMPIPGELRPGQTQTRRLFIIDDEPRVITALKRSIEFQAPSVSVDGSTDGIEALIEIGANPPDLILLDIYMGTIDGFEVCRRLRRVPALAAVQIIAMSGRADESDRRRILACGAQHYLDKPVRVGQILALADVRAVGA